MKPHVLVLCATTILTGGVLRAEDADSRASFDCAKARSTHERVICASPETRKADATVAKAFATAKGALSPAQAQALVVSQRDFNTYLAKICWLDGAMPKSAEAQTVATFCLTNGLGPRAEFLDGLKVAIAGSLRLEPRVTTAHRILPGESRNGWITDDAMPVLIGAPAAVEKAFAAEIREIYNAGQPLIAGRTTLVGAVTRDYRVATMDENFVSLSVTERVETGVSVPPREEGLNFDLKTGRPVALDDIFKTSQAWRTAMKTALRKDLNHPEEFDHYVDHVLDNGKGVNWLFFRDKIEVNWVGSQQPGEFVEVPVSVVAPFLKPDSPWKPVTR